MNDLHFLELRSGGFTIIDAHNVSAIRQMSNKWRLNPNGYVFCCRNSGVTFLHRVVNKTPEGFDTHHKNHCLIDNTERNLQTVTRSDNCRHRVKYEGPFTRSKYKGVTWHARDMRWQACIRFDGQNRHLGYFTKEVDAARAYNVAALKYFGEFALLNPV